MPEPIRKVIEKNCATLTRTLHEQLALIELDCKAAYKHECSSGGDAAEFQGAINRILCLAHAASSTAKLRTQLRKILEEPASGSSHTKCN